MEKSSVNPPTAALTASDCAARVLTVREMLDSRILELDNRAEADRIKSEALTILKGNLSHNFLSRSCHVLYRLNLI